MRFSSPAFLLVAFAYTSAGVASAQLTARVSVGERGAQGDHESSAGAVSANGRYVAFFSTASNLVPGDTNGVGDIFVRDRALRTTTRVSVDSSGAQSDGFSFDPGISADGRFVTFWSTAENLVPGDTNDLHDVFLHDRDTGITTRVSVDSNGAQADGRSISPDISATGRFIAFASNSTNLVTGDSNYTYDVFVHDREFGTTTRVSVTSTGAQLLGGSTSPSISADGFRVAFESLATFVPGDNDGGALDVFVWDNLNGTTTCVNVHPSGVPMVGQKPEISGDGRFVAFLSAADNLVPGDTNGKTDVFVRDLDAGSTTIVSVGTNGVQSDQDSWNHSISYHGRFVAFESWATTFVPIDANGSIPDIFVRDRGAGTTTLVSVNSLGAQANSLNHHPTISLGGRHVVFDSRATNLAHGDTNGSLDVFVRDLP